MFFLLKKKGQDKFRRNRKKNVFNTVAAAARKFGVYEGTVRYALRNKNDSFTRRKDKKVFFIQKVETNHSVEDFRIKINGECFPTLKGTADRFRVPPGTIQYALKTSNSIIVRRADKKILEISSLSKRKFKTRICVR